MMKFSEILRGNLHSVLNTGVLKHTLSFLRLWRNWMAEGGEFVYSLMYFKQRHQKDVNVVESLVETNKKKRNNYQG